MTKDECPPGTRVRWVPPYIGDTPPDELSGEVIDTPDNWPYPQTQEQAYVLVDGQGGVAFAVDYERLNPDA